MEEILGDITRVSLASWPSKLLVMSKCKRGEKDAEGLMSVMGYVV